MLTVVVYFINNESPFEDFKIFSNISKIEQEEYCIYLDRSFSNEEIINIKKLKKYEIYDSGSLIKSADFENK